MLSEYKGASNSPDMLQHLVGETIRGAMLDNGYMVLVLGSGVALVLTCARKADEHHVPAFWVEASVEVRLRISRRVAQIERQQKELKEITWLSAALVNLASPPQREE